MNQGTAEIACSLNAEETRERRVFVRKALIPKALKVRETESGWHLTFENSEQLKSDVTLFVELESQCCGFLDYQISSDDAEFVLTIEGPPKALPILSGFISDLVKV